MKFFTSLKQQHVALLQGLPNSRIQRALLGVVLAITGLSTLILFGFFGGEILDQILPIYEAETGTSFPIGSQMLPIIIGVFAVLSMISEYFWIVLVTYVTGRVLKYLKKPLSFKHVCNIYLLIRMYEMATSFAILLGVTVVSLYMHQTLPWLTEDEGGVLSFITSFIVPVGFMWLYISSVKRMMHQSSTKK